MTYRDQCIVGDPKVVRGVIKDCRGRMGVFIWLRAPPNPSPLPNLTPPPLSQPFPTTVNYRLGKKSGHERLSKKWTFYCQVRMSGSYRQRNLKQ